MASAQRNFPLRRTACIPCTKAKRRCGKELPACQRCLEKEVQCQYTSTRPYARQSSRLTLEPAERFGPRKPSPQLAAGAADTTCIALPTSAENANAFSGSRVDNGNAVNEALNTVSLGLLFDDNQGDKVGARPPGISWFLQNESWVIHYTETTTAPCMRVSRLTRYTRWVRSWLQQWVTESHCPFIHQELFADTGLPQCLQDSFAALTVIAAKNYRNEDTVRQFIETKLTALLQEYEEKTATQPLPTIQLLACAQALFIYQFLCLFGDDIRLRSQAETYIPKLTDWTRRLWASTNFDASIQTTLGNDFFPQDHGDSITKLWRSWILAESVRRIWMTTNYVQCIYLSLRDAHAMCEGSVTFTAREGLWDAMSASAWFAQLAREDPLFILSYDVGNLLEANNAPDLDVFALSVISIMLESDKVESWMARTPNKRWEDYSRV